MGPLGGYMDPFIDCHGFPCRFDQDYMDPLKDYMDPLIDFMDPHIDLMDPLIDFMDSLIDYMDPLIDSPRRFHGSPL